MAYWVRAICTSDTVPTIRDLPTWLRKQSGFAAAEVPDEGPKALASAKWKSFELVYDPAKESILVECNRNTGSRSLCAGEVREELESLEDLEGSLGRKRLRWWRGVEMADGGKNEKWRIMADNG
jgi:hypothetical protein